MSSPRLSCSSQMRSRASKWTRLDRERLMYCRNPLREHTPRGGNKRAAIIFETAANSHSESSRPASAMSASSALATGRPSS